MASAVTPYVERVVQFGPMGGRVGVLTAPRGQSANSALLILGAGILHRIGPSRASVAVARYLARQGVRSLRFDHAGIGDSDRGNERLRETVLADVSDGVDILLRGCRGAQAPLAILGFCSGADTAIVCAGLDERIGRLALFDPLVPRTSGHFARVVRRQWSRATVGGFIARVRRRVKRMPETRAPEAPNYFGLVAANGREFRDTLELLNARRVQRLWLMTSGVRDYCSDPRQIAEVLGRGASMHLDRVEWNAAADHVLSSVGQRDWLCRTMASWMSTAALPLGGDSVPAALRPPVPTAPRHWTT